MRFFWKIDIAKPKKAINKSECLSNGTIKPLKDSDEEVVKKVSVNKGYKVSNGIRNEGFEEEVQKNEKKSEEDFEKIEANPVPELHNVSDDKVNKVSNGIRNEGFDQKVLRDEKKNEEDFEKMETDPVPETNESKTDDSSWTDLPEKDNDKIRNHKENCVEPSRRHSFWEAIHTKLTKLLDHPNLIHWTTLCLIALAVWCIVYSIAGSGFLPGSQLFSLIVLFVLAFISGELIKLVKLPPLLGMLLMGIILRNVGFIHLSGVYMEVTATLREIALCIILIRAGLGLDPKALKSLRFVILRLASLPGIVEGTITTIVTHFLLGLPWLWGLLLGTILAAVSPAVVIPCLFSLQERGYGTGKGIPTLVVAAASLDDIFAITVFGVVLNMIYSTGDSILMQVVQGPLGILIGIVFGVVWGYVANFVPHHKDDQVVLLRVLMIIGGGLMAIVGSGAIGYQGAGPLGCIIAAFVACLGWRKQDYSDEYNPVAKVFRVIWLVFQPILFGLIGSEVDVSVLEFSTIGNGLIALFCSLLGRIVVTVFVGFGAGLNWKEKSFLAWAWFPKATVQAALAPLVLDIARSNGSEDDIIHARKILILAVLAILITAPIGAALITALGPKLLSKSNDSSNTEKCKEEVSLEAWNENDRQN